MVDTGYLLLDAGVLMPNLNINRPFIYIRKSSKESIAASTHSVYPYQYSRTTFITY